MHTQHTHMHECTCTYTCDCTCSFKHAQTCLHTRSKRAYVATTTTFTHMSANVHNEVKGVETHPRTHLCMYVHSYRVPVVGADSRAESLTVGMHSGRCPPPGDISGVLWNHCRLTRRTTSSCPSTLPPGNPTTLGSLRSSPALSAQTPLEMPSMTSYLRNFHSFRALFYTYKTKPVESHSYCG